MSPMAWAEFTGEETDEKKGLELFDEMAVNFSSQTHAKLISNIMDYDHVSNS